MGHGYAMTIADYIAFGILIALALWAGAMQYGFQPRMRRTNG
jgi:hypothetical protein